jgi:exopolyphosphatase
MPPTPATIHPFPRLPYFATILALSLFSIRVAHTLPTIAQGRAVHRISTTALTMKQPSLEDFLASQKQQNDLPHVVVGNAAGDADSIISALTYGYIESTLSSTPTKTPIVSITKRDLVTQRPEVSFMFRALGLDSDVVDSMRFIDDPLLQDGKARNMTLVDHNRLENSFHAEHWNVVEILDHHFDEQQHLETCSGDDRNIAFEGDKALVASTCTLVAERWKALHKNQNKYHATLSTLLLGTILLDSVNMIPQAGKGTPRDAAAIQDLLDHTDWSTLASPEAVQAWWLDNPSLPLPIDSKPDPTRMFESLQAAKFDPEFWKGLSVPDALRLDYKRFSAAESHVLGASAILLPLSDFLAKENLVEGIQQYMRNDVEVDFLAILFFFTTPEGENRRQLMLCGSESKLVDDMATFLLKEEMLQLQESNVDGVVCSGNGQLSIRLFDQNNAKASRKQVAPLLIKFFESQ